jgi:hypothetical protein
MKTKYSKQTNDVTNENVVEKVLKDEITGEELLNAIHAGRVTDVGTIKDSLLEDRNTITDADAVQAITQQIETAEAKNDTARVGELSEACVEFVQNFRRHVGRDTLRTLEFKVWCAAIPETLHYSSLDPDSKHNMRQFLSCAIGLTERYGSRKLDSPRILFKILGEIIEIDIEAGREIEAKAADRPAHEAIEKLIDVLYEYRGKKGSGDQASLERARYVLWMEQVFAGVLAACRRTAYR